MSSVGCFSAAHKKLQIIVQPINSMHHMIALFNGHRKNISTISLICDECDNNHMQLQYYSYEDFPRK